MTVDPKYEYASESSLQHANYMKNSKAIGVLWGVFTICFAIIVVVVFIQPHWLGDTQESRGTGHFGLWQACRMVQDGQDVICEGKLTDFNSIPTPAFRAATVFIGLSVVIILLCICCMVLFFVFHSSTVFHICGWMQVFCATCMVIGVLTFPAGWDSEIVREVCGPQADDYNPGQCGVRWAYILAIIGVCDCGVLAALAFVLGTRYVKLLPEHYITSGSLYKGEVNSAFIADNQSTPSRKSTNIQPVMVVPPGVESDHYSEYSHHTLRSNKGFRQDTFSNNSVANFQL
ncbi:LHFPL tetraspan subfamily member 3 protein-like isoform X2 [Argiope bruennichi]|uniref:LHFPL tetraspan subfamily member 4 protein n=4 Tax=Araneoidea TaxID=74975 RepID=A0A8X6UH89_NEPPI|nr:LHFPL tetraspan subfamily member 3 protein-like isoform X2 [Argiope bruennichi]KAF8766776.1 LHFPL tetraspan subfamily member 3 protein like [Argiope bruennichi]GFU09844.1 LHFPL tetraspan subfamily member 4 protein [Nephila pilipes]